MHGEVSAWGDVRAEGSTMGSLSSRQKLDLTGTTVHGEVSAWGDVSAIGATMRSLSSRASVVLSPFEGKASRVAESLKSWGNIKMEGGNVGTLYSRMGIVLKSVISGSIEAWQNVEAESCQRLGAIHSRNDVILRKCPAVESVDANNGVHLTASHVLGDVVTRKTARLVDSVIDKNLRCHSQDLSIVASHVDTLVVQSEGVVGGISIIASGDRAADGGDGWFSSFFSGSGGGGSASITFGNEIRGDSVSICNENISVTGSHIQLPRDCNPDTTFVNGRSLRSIQGRDAAEPERTAPLQVVTLRDSIVRRVVFEGGNGEVILEGDSRVKEPIEGGKIQEK